ncbi:MAG: hypothetical protein Kow0089_15930 [Desulfobulbaceae bacterium]
MRIEPDAERRNTRLHCDRRVEMEFIGEGYENCRVRDISLSGMYVLGDFSDQPGRACHLRLIPGKTSPGPGMLAEAKLVRRDAKGAAVAFRSMDFESYMSLQTFLFEAADDPSLVDRLLDESCPFEITDEPPPDDEPITPFV